MTIGRRARTAGSSEEEGMKTRGGATADTIGFITRTMPGLTTRGSPAIAGVQAWLPHCGGESTYLEILDTCPSKFHDAEAQHPYRR